MTMSIIEWKLASLIEPFISEWVWTGKKSFVKMSKCHIKYRIREFILFLLIMSGPNLWDNMYVFLQHRCDLCQSDSKIMKYKNCMFKFPKSTGWTQLYKLKSQLSGVCFMNSFCHLILFKAISIVKSTVFFKIFVLEKLHDFKISVWKAIQGEK